MKKFTLALVSIFVLGIACLIAQAPGYKLQMAESAIKQLYVDTVNEEKLVEDAIRGMLENLDPHSSYSNAEETKELNEPLQGNFSGIGITFNMNQDTLYVIQTVAGGQLRIGAAQRLQDGRMSAGGVVVSKVEHTIYLSSGKISPVVYQLWWQYARRLHNLL